MTNILEFKSSSASLLKELIEEAPKVLDQGQKIQYALAQAQIMCLEAIREEINCIELNIN